MSSKPPVKQQFTIRKNYNINENGKIIQKEVWKTGGPNAKEGDRNVSTEYTAETCKIGKDTCVRGNKEDLLIRGKWTFLPEQGRIKHFLKKGEEGSFQYKGKFFTNAASTNQNRKNYSHNHYFTGEGDAGFKDLFNFFVKHKLLEDTSGNLITNEWDFEQTTCTTDQQPIYTSVSMPYKLKTYNGQGCKTPNQGTGLNKPTNASATAATANNATATAATAKNANAKGGRRRSKTRKTKSRKTNTRRR